MNVFTFIFDVTIEILEYQMSDTKSPKNVEAIFDGGIGGSSICVIYFINFISREGAVP